ncbi:hypothetical protein Tco_0794483 [Tanacetum coccineum]
MSASTWMPRADTWIHVAVWTQSLTRLLTSGQPPLIDGIRGSVRGSDKEASRKADVAHCGWWIRRMTAANDEVRGMGSRANDWCKD